MEKSVYGARYIQANWGWRLKGQMNYLLACVWLRLDRTRPNRVKTREKSQKKN